MKKGNLFYSPTPKQIENQHANMVAKKDRDEKHITIVIPGIPENDKVIHNRFYKYLTKKGISLKNIVHPIFDKQRISLNSHSVLRSINVVAVISTKG